MTLSSIQILALIFLVVAAVKILVLLIYPKAWVKVIKKVWINSQVMMIISLVLAIIVFYLLVQELSLTQIFAVMLFTALLAAVGVSIYSESVVRLAVRLLGDREIVKKSWLYILVWVILIFWGLKELFIL